MAREIERSEFRICFLITRREKEAFEFHCKEAGLTLSQFVRLHIAPYLRIPKKKIGKRSKALNAKKEHP